MRNKALVILSYGNESEFYRAIYALLSFSAWYSDHMKAFSILVYTDNPDFFRQYLDENTNLQIEYIYLSKTYLDDMVGDTKYIHRRKVYVIDLAFKSHPGKDILFIDSDTFFFKHSPKIVNDISYYESLMHKREYSLQEGLEIFEGWGLGSHPKAFIKYISKNAFLVDGSWEKFTALDYSWNSGVLGISKDNAKYLPDIFNLTDNFFLNSEWFISEQLAFSLVLQRRTTIFAVDDVVIHYWGKRQKKYMDKMLGDFLTSTSATKFKSVSLIKDSTRYFHKSLLFDIMLEQAIIALKHKHWRYGILKSLQVLLKKPFDKSTIVELYEAITN